MKKFTLIVIMMLSSFSGFAQSLDSVFIYKDTDDMTDEVYFFASRKIVCIDEVDNLGFSISFFVDQKKDGSLSASDLYIKTVNFGCIENLEAIFLFEDGSKVTCNSWNKFNCEDRAFCQISEADKKIMASQKVTKIRVTNKRNMRTYTSVVEPNNQDYFIQFFKALEKNDVRQYEEK
jgi:hypothetical protein